jgi:propanol-preferring alcohol dehydrogenase
VGLGLIQLCRQAGGRVLAVGRSPRKLELVGSQETLPLVLSSVAKHGRAVFIGYTGAQMELSPLGLVLLEGTVTASVGNTLAELRRAVELVEEGRVRTVVDRVATFEEIGQALQDLAAGRILGRVVLRPSG